MLLLEPFGVTDAGKVRRNNEDSLIVGEGRDETLFAVADGIGGFGAGGGASRIAIEVLGGVQAGFPFEGGVGEGNPRVLAAGRGEGGVSGEDGKTKRLN